MNEGRLDMLLRVIQTGIQAVGVFVTLTAVAVAIWASLYPALREGKRRKAQARVLRGRLTTALALINPTFQWFVIGNELPTTTKDHVLDRQGLVDAIERIDKLAADSYLLEPEEQDKLSWILSNAFLCAQIFKTHEPEKLPTGTARKITDAILDLEELFKKNGYFSC